MTERPPSDPADHAEDFSRRYAEDLEISETTLPISHEARELLKKMEAGWRGR